MSCLSIANFLLLKFAYLDFVVHDMYPADSSSTSQQGLFLLHVEISKLPAIAKFLVGYGSCYGPCIQALLTRTVFNLCNRLITKAINVCQEKMSMDSHSSQSSIARSSASYIKRVQVLSISVLMHRSVLLLKHHTSALRLL